MTLTVTEDVSVSIVGAATGASGDSRLAKEGVPLHDPRPRPQPLLLPVALLCFWTALVARCVVAAAPRQACARSQ